MTASTTLHLPTILTTTDERVAAEIGNVAIQALAGAVAGLALGIINPIGGAIFGAVFSAAKLVGEIAIDALRIQEEGAKTALRLAGLVISMKLGIAATAFIGFTMTTFGGIGMILGMGAVTILTHMACANARDSH